MQSILEKLVVSPLGHTWLIDLDGCVLRHNDYLRGADTLLPGVLEFWARIPAEDTIVLLTSRVAGYADITIESLRRFGLRYDRIIFDLPFGERILINDKKPSGLQTAYALNVQRDIGLGAVDFTIDHSL